MIKKLSLLMLLMALFAPWAANAQETLTVHNGTTTNSYVPFYGLWVDDYTRSEMIYPANELSSMTDGVISSLSFYKSSSSTTSSWGSATFQVYLNEVTNTSLSAYIGMTNATIVYEGSIDASGGERQVTINFTTPYYYNGGNLLVGIYETTTGTYSSAYWYGENITGASASGYNSSSPASATFNQRNFLPKTTFTYEVSSSSCPRPTDLTVSNITSTSATFTWNGSSDSYNVLVKESSQTEPTNYTYDFEDGWQGWTTFQGNTTSPNSWMHNSAYPISNNDFSTGYGYNSSDGFMLSESYISGDSQGSGTAVTPDNYLVSPQVPLGGSISFYAGARNIEYCAEKFSVMVSTTDNNNAASFTTVGTWTLSLTQAGYNPTPYTVDLSAYSGMGYIAIRHFDCYDQWFLAVDNITIDTDEASTWTTYPASTSPFTINNLNPGTTYDVKVIGICDGQESYPSTTINFTTEIACPAPTDVTVSEITAHEATVNWGGSSESYNVYLGTVGTPTNILDVNFSSGIPNNWNNDATYPWTVTGGYIKSGNSGVTSSSSSISVVVTFPADGTIDFDAECMGEGSSSYYDHCDFYIDGTRMFYHGADLGSGWNHYTYDVTTGQHTFTWSYTKDSSVNPTGDYFAIDNVVMVSSSIIWGEPIHVENNQYTFSGLTPETNYFVKVQSDCGDEGLSADSEPVTFTTEISCPAPTNLIVSEIDGHGATVSWDKIATQATGDITYNYTWVEHGGTPDWTLHGGMSAFDRWTNEAGPRAFAFGLEPETEYDFYVRRDCGEEGYSAEVMVPFTTTVTCPAPTDVTVSDITGHEATVTWTGTSDNYIVKYRTAAYMDGIEESFDSGNLPSGWEQKTGLLSSIMEGTALTDSYQWYFGNQNGVFDYHARINIYGSSRYGWLITPETNVGNGFGISFDLALTAYSGTGAASGTCDDDRFVVLVYADNEWHILREWNNSGSSYVFNNIPTAGQNVSIDLSSYAGKTVKIAFYGESTTTGNGDNNLHIDNVTIGLPIAAGEWQTTTAEETTITLTGLTSETLYEVVVQGDCGDEGLSADSDPTTFTTDVTCPAPTGLAVSEISGHGATVSWDRIATQETGRITFNYVCVANGDTLNWDNASIIIDDVDNPDPPTVNLTGLDPETTYTFYVRKDCGEEGYSAVVMVTFTTDVTCPVPTEMNVSDITGHEATVTWTGYSENYVVEVGSYDYTATPTTGIIQEEDFEGGSMPTDWTHIGNGSVNMYSSNSSHVHDGTYSLQFSGATADNVLVLPQFAARPSSLQISFWSKCESTSYSGQFDFGYVTDASDASSFVAVETYTASQHSSYQYVENISITTAPANARIAFRHRSGSTAWYWFIDDITIKGPVYPMIWTEYTTDDPTYTFEGLTPETTYFVSVQGDCGDEGMSAISDTITFITDISCPAPTPQEPTNVTSSSAVLNWTGDAESYNVSYYKTFFFDSFEEDLSQWTIYKEGDDASWEWGIENPHDNSADLNAHSGSYATVAYSDIDVHANNWLISPQILFPNQTTLKFWIMRSTYDDAPDEYEVRLSTTGNATEDFDVVLKEMEAANSEWTEVVIDLSAYDGQQGYIAIHHDYTGGFFIMVDDFGIFGWSEEITTTDNSLLIEDLLPETEYLWQVQANCGEEGESAWSNIDNFTTLKACPVPFDLNVSEITANGATIAWTGYNENYEVMVSEGIYMSYDFEDNAISSDFTTTTDYPWTVVANNHSGVYCAKSGNGGNHSTTSDMVLEVTLAEECTLSFTAKVSSESTYDKAYFSIDGVESISAISGAGSWIDYSYTLGPGTHTLRWYYTKDSSVNSNDDCFYVDDIIIQSSNEPTWITYTATESPFILNDATNILPETTYSVKVIGFCEGVATEDSEIITFTTLDENTKIFVIEGDWNDGDNWVPVGVPTIDDDVILRAEATVFDVAEANIIAIDETGVLIIEDGGQLKTNADVEATMKKFIIGYGTDYVETSNGYYLMTLPTAAPISATDAGLMTEESDYDLYGWDRTATDEEWQNNHDGIDLQNGIGFLYANRDDMEMSFTATLRNSGEPVVVTPAYDEVEHGGWNLCGNPFPCEAYIITDAEGMTFYRLIDNELVPIEGAIAPLEAFFVKATAVGQTFTISREAPAK